MGKREDFSYEIQYTKAAAYQTLTEDIESIILKKVTNQW